MISLFKAGWWKFVCVTLLLYTIIMGLIIPLGPGITSISPESEKYLRVENILAPNDTQVEFKIKNETVINLTGYNTRFKQAENSVQVWMEVGMTGMLVCSKKVQVIDDTHLKATFDFNTVADQIYNTTLFHVLVNDDLDGTFILRSGFTLYHDEIKQKLSHPENICSVEVNSNESESMTYPNRDILIETIRNVYFHVPMWFAMTLILIFAVVYNIIYLRNGNMMNDLIASQAILTAIVFGVAGMITGMVWAKFTWGAFWTNDPRLTGALIGMLIYLAYFILRGSFNDEIRRARVSSVYSIFAFVMFIVFVGVLPRMSEGTLHPGVGGNPAFSQYDLDDRMKLVFYPAVIGWTMLGFWIISLHVRYKIKKNETDEME